MTENHKNTFIPYGKQWIDEADEQAVLSVLRSDYITQGPWIEEFEARIANRVGTKYAVAFSNGTAALHGACYAAGIGAGDEVITSPITFLASANCALYQGAKPVFADIDMDTYNIDPDQIIRHISERTKAIIPVDFSGQPVEIDRIMDIARENELVVIEDAAHSLGATYKGKPVGCWADMTMFSFHPVKHITTGEGGMIVTNNKEYYEKLIQFRSHGMTRNPELLTRNDGPWYYEMQSLGYNYRMTDIQAALGSSQLNRLDEFVARRQQIAASYNAAFAELEGIVLPAQAQNTYSSWHLFVIRWNTQYFKVDRRSIFESLRAEGIGVHVHYIPVYKQPYYQLLGYGNEECSNAEVYYDTALTLPIFPKMTDREISTVVSAVKKVYFTCHNSTNN
ncbi:UDP-4-amino-4,6-dideoxy-N-acetyl-beta-L-altrosamine transaminase [Paenibacillus marinisediminis]